MARRIQTAHIPELPKADRTGAASRVPLEATPIGAELVDHMERRRRMREGVPGPVPEHLRPND